MAGGGRLAVAVAQVAQSFTAFYEGGHPYLKRAPKTAWLMLDEMEAQWVPITNTAAQRATMARCRGATSARSESTAYAKCRSGGRARTARQTGTSRRPRASSTDEGRRAAVPTAESLAECRERLEVFMRETLMPDM